MFEGKKILITGGTGSLGQALTERLLKEKVDTIRIFSRNEEKQVSMENKFHDKENKRVVTGICFDNVLNVKKKNFPKSDTLQVLNFLTVKKTDQFVELIFADNILIKLDGKNISFRIDDLNKEWPTIFSPLHSIN